MAREYTSTTHVSSLEVAKDPCQLLRLGEQRGEGLPLRDGQEDGLGGEARPQRLPQVVLVHVAEAHAGGGERQQQDGVAQQQAKGVWGETVVSLDRCILHAIAAFPPLPSAKVGALSERVGA